MANLSNRSTPNSNTQSNHTTAINAPLFKVGDRVLCPMAGEGLKSYVLTADPYKQNERLTVTTSDSHFYFDSNGFFVRANKAETLDYLPSLFNDTPANRQLITSLYPSIGLMPTSKALPNARTIIDVTDPDDKEIIAMPSSELVDISSDLANCINVLDDIGLLLSHIHYKKINARMAISMARLAHESIGTWVTLLNADLEYLNGVIEQTRFNKVEVIK